MSQNFSIVARHFDGAQHFDGHRLPEIEGILP